MKDSFVLYTSMLKSTKKLSLEQKGKLFEAIIEYQMTGEVPEIDDLAVDIYFDMIKNQMDIDNKKYKETLEKRKEAGKKGGRPKKEKTENQLDNDDVIETETIDEKANGFEKNQKVLKKANGFSEKLNDNDNVNENVNENDNENVNEEYKKEKKLYARDKIFEEALNKAEVQTLLTDLKADETFLAELINYRKIIQKPISSIKMLTGLLEDFKITMLQTSKSAYELFEIMQRQGWKTITTTYVENLEKARKVNKKSDSWIEDASKEIEEFVKGGAYA